MVTMWKIVLLLLLVRASSNTPATCLLCAVRGRPPAFQLAMQLRGGSEPGAEDANTARDVAKAAALLERARAGYAAAGVRPPDKIEQIDALNRLLTGKKEKDALIKGDKAALDRLKRTMGITEPDMEPEEATVIDSDEDQEDWERGVDKMKAEGDAIEKEIRTGVKRGPNFNHWDEIPALRKAELMINEDPYHPFWKAVRDGNADRLRYLLESSAKNGKLNDINHPYPALWNSTLLHVAAECDDVEITTILVRSGSDLEQRNDYKQAPLHLASYWGNTEMARRLVDMGADVEVRSSDDSTPLHIAAFYGQNDTAKELVGLGASLTSVNSHNQNALQLAEMGKWHYTKVKGKTHMLTFTTWQMDLASWLRQLMGLPEPPEGQEQSHVVEFEQLKEQAIERLAQDLEQKLDARAEGGPGDGFEGPMPHADIRAGIRAAVEKQAHMDATLALRTKLRKGYGDKGSALAAAAAAAAAAASAAATKGHYSQ